MHDIKVPLMALIVQDSDTFKKKRNRGWAIETHVFKRTDLPGIMHSLSINYKNL